MSAVKIIGRSGLEWFFVRGYSARQIAAIYGLSLNYIYMAVRAYYGADWKNVLKTKKEAFDYEQSSISQLVCG